MLKTQAQGRISAIKRKEYKKSGKGNPCRSLLLLFSMLCFLTFLLRFHCFPLFPHCCYFHYFLLLSATSFISATFVAFAIFVTSAIFVIFVISAIYIIYIFSVISVTSVTYIFSGIGMAKMLSPVVSTRKTVCKSRCHEALRAADSSLMI